MAQWVKSSIAKPDSEFSPWDLCGRGREPSPHGPCGTTDLFAHTCTLNEETQQKYRRRRGKERKSTDQQKQQRRLMRCSGKEVGKKQVLLSWKPRENVLYAHYTPLPRVLCGIFVSVQTQIQSTYKCWVFFPFVLSF